MMPEPDIGVVRFLVPQLCFQMMLWTIRSVNTNVNKGYVKLGMIVFHQTHIFIIFD